MHSKSWPSLLKQQGSNLISQWSSGAQECTSSSEDQKLFQQLHSLRLLSWHQWDRFMLTCIPIVPRKTFTLPMNLFTLAFVQAFDIIMSSIMDHIASSVHHHWESIHCFIWRNSQVNHNYLAVVTNLKRFIKITRWGIKLRLSKRTSSCNVKNRMWMRKGQFGQTEYQSQSICVGLNEQYVTCQFLLHEHISWGTCWHCPDQAFKHSAQVKPNNKVPNTKVHILREPHGIYLLSLCLIPFGLVIDRLQTNLIWW